MNCPLITETIIQLTTQQISDAYTDAILKLIIFGVTSTLLGAGLTWGIKIKEKVIQIICAVLEIPGVLGIAYYLIKIFELQSCYSFIK